LPVKALKCAWFDGHDYFEFFPLQAVKGVAANGVRLRMTAHAGRRRWENSELQIRRDSSLEEQRAETALARDRAAGLEPRLRRIRNYRALPLLREAIKRQLQSLKKSAA
jgi:hypothetical protein